MSPRMAGSMPNLEYRSKILYTWHVFSILGRSFLCHLKFQLNLPGFSHFHLIFFAHKKDFPGNSFSGEHKHQLQSSMVSSHTTTYVNNNHQDGCEKCNMLGKKALTIAHFVVVNSWVTLDLFYHLFHCSQKILQIFPF